MERIRIANLPTRISKLEKLSREYGKNIYVKRDDMTGTEISGNKVRKLEYILAEAQDKGIDTLITAGGIQSNHARATAAVCAMYGLGCHLVLRGRPSEIEGNFWMDYMLGAEIHVIEPALSREEYMEGLSEKLVSEGKRPMIIPVGASNATGSLGYEEAFYEIQEQEKELGVKFDAIAVSVGSGGTYAGLLAGKIKAGSGIRIQGYAVDSDSRTFEEEVGKILADMGMEKTGEIHINDSYKGTGYALSQDEELKFYKKVAKEEGIILDPCYTGKAFYGMVNELRGELKDCNNILFIHTGGLYGWTKTDREKIIKI